MRIDEIADQRQVLQLDARDHDIRNQAQDRQVQAAHHRDLGSESCSCSRRYSVPGRMPGMKPPYLRMLSAALIAD